MTKNRTQVFKVINLFLDQTSYYLTLNKLEVNENAWMHESEYSVCSSISWGQKTLQLQSNRANFLCHNGLKYFLLSSYIYFEWCLWNNLSMTQGMTEARFFTINQTQTCVFRKNFSSLWIFLKEGYTYWCLLLLHSKQR